RSRHTLQQQVRGSTREARELPGQAAVHQEAVDAALELLEAFGLDLVPPRDRGDDEALLAAQLRCRERRELLTEERLVAGLAVRGAQLHFAAGAEEVEEAIRRGRLRADEVLVRVTVHAAALRAQTGLEEQPLVEQPHGLLQVERDRALLRELLVHGGVRAAVHVPLARQQVLRADEERAQTAILILHTGRRRRGERVRRPRVDAVQVPVPEHAAAAALDGLAGQRLGALEEQLVG